MVCHFHRGYGITTVVPYTSRNITSRNGSFCRLGQGNREYTTRKRLFWKIIVGIHCLRCRETQLSSLSEGMCYPIATLFCTTSARLKCVPRCRMRRGIKREVHRRITCALEWVQWSWTFVVAGGANQPISICYTQIIPYNVACTICTSNVQLYMALYVWLGSRLPLMP